MELDFIPDSDPGDPILDPNTPQWFHLSSNGRGHGGDRRIKKREEAREVSTTGGTSQYVEDSSAPHSRPNAQEEMHNDRPLGIPAPVSETREAADTVYPPPQGVEDGQDMMAQELPRRRRFDFETWVASEKKVHEYVNHRKYKWFHGALSDSEDDDYGEIEVEASQSDQENPDGIIPSTGMELHELHSSADIGSTSVRSTRPKVIDSESESGSDESVDAGSDLETIAALEDVPNYEKRLSRAIPASKLRSKAQEQGDDDILRASLEDSEFGNSDVDEFPQNSIDSNELGPVAESATDVVSFGIPRDVREVAPIDYMLSRPSRVSESPASVKHKARRGTIGRRRQTTLDAVFPVQRRQAVPNARRPQSLSVVDIARSAGSTSSPALRIAARTATNRMAKRGSTRKGEAVKDNPLKKVFAGAHSREASKTLRRWRRGDISLSGDPTNSTLALPPSMPLNETENVSFGKKRRKGCKPQKRRRYAETPSSLFHTTILEKPANTRATTSMDLSHTASSSAIRRKPYHLPLYEPRARETPLESAEPGSGTLGRYQTDSRAGKVYVDASRPSKPLIASAYPRTTFIGSNILDLLDRPTVWNGQTVSSGKFGTPLAEANEAIVARDCSLLFDIYLHKSELIDGDLYDELYDYFLEGTAFLCDESQIVHDGFRKFVLHEWLRLARSSLKVRLRKIRLRSHYAALVPLLAALATLLVSRRVRLLTGASMEKVDTLLGWVIYYNQHDISTQIDISRYDRSTVGAELVYFCVNRDVAKILPRVFAKGRCEANWHILVILSATQPSWFDWDLARSLIATVSDSYDARTALDYSRALLLKWNWPPQAELVIDFFIYYAKQHQYADPRGESIWLPRFLLTTSFDGKALPDQDFSVFLEILGLTLTRVKDDLQICRRISGRVTPLSSMAFPETDEVSLADLSRASHQYGILIVLLRVLPDAMKPSVRQFRDLVVLHNSHIAMRVKAVSAWSMVAQLVTTLEDKRECSIWLSEEILQESPPPALVSAALHTCIEVFNKANAAIPMQRLLDLSFRSLDGQARDYGWRLISCLRGDELASTLSAIGESTTYGIDESDMAWWIKLSQNEPLLAFKWPIPESLPEVVAALMRDGRLGAGAVPVQKEILKSLLKPEWTSADVAILMAAGFKAVDEPGNRSQILEDFLRTHHTLVMFEYALALVHENWERLGGRDLDYNSVVAHARRVVFEAAPGLAASNQWFNDRDAMAVELSQVSIMNFIRQEGGNFEGQYFFAFKLQRSLQKDQGNSFIADILGGLSLSDATLAVQAFDFVINELFAFYFEVAISSPRHLRVALPTLVKAARLGMSRGVKLHYNPSVMIGNVVAYCNSVVKDTFVHDSGSWLVIELYRLAFIWLHQAVARFGKLPSDLYMLLAELWTLAVRISRMPDPWPPIGSDQILAAHRHHGVFEAKAITGTLQGADVHFDTVTLDEVARTCSSFVALSVHYSRAFSDEEIYGEHFISRNDHRWLLAPAWDKAAWHHPSNQ